MRFRHFASISLSSLLFLAPLAGRAGAPAAPPAVDVPAFTLADVGATAKLRFSVAGSAPVDAAQAEWSTVVSASDRRFRIQGATPVAGGKPAVYVEFGRGSAAIEKGVYDCAQMHAVVAVIERDGKRNVTAVQNAPQRTCKVVIDALQEVQPSRPGAQPFRKVVGHVEADVGPREDAIAPTKKVRATFAATVM